MKNNLAFDFVVNKENNTITITREFAAGRGLVWEAWTTPEILDQWWAPKPYKTVTKSQDLKEGGNWLYAMVSPENEKHWCIAEYKTIDPEKLLSWLDAFCDEEGNINTVKPRSLWTNTFTESNGVTTVQAILKHNSYEEIEQMISMGFKEGLTMALGNLDELLPKL